MEPRYIVAIEIGSSKIKGAVGTQESDGTLSIVAADEERLTDCVRYGCIQNVEEVANCIGRIVGKLENQISQRKVKSVYVALGGHSLHAIQREVSRQFNEEIEIAERLVDDLKRDAAKMTIDRDVVGVEPRDFEVDGRRVERLAGTVGQNVKGVFGVVVCKPQIQRNLNLAIGKRLQLLIADTSVRQIDIANMVLTNDERRLGSMVVDFGAETTTVSIYKNGTMRYLATIPLGSRNITRDLTRLNFIEERAEELKKQVGNVNPSKPKTSNSEFDGVVTTEINNYISARAGEIVANIVEQMAYAGYSSADLPAGIVLVGGGARLNGFTELLQQQSKLKVRQGMVSPNIRISPRIQPTEFLDVIAAVNTAARQPAATCVEIVEAPVQEETGEQVPADAKDDEESLFEDEKPKRKGVISSILGRLGKIIDPEDSSDYFDESN